MESKAKTDQEQITIQQVDEIFEEIDCFWLMWDDVKWVENLPSPKPANKYVKHIPFLPPIDFRPLVARNQFVSQTRLENALRRIQQNALAFSFPHTNAYADESTSLVEETIHDVSSAFQSKMINDVLPSPQQADYIDLLEVRRRPSFGTTLKMFAKPDKQTSKASKGYSSSEFWRSFLGSRYPSMNIMVEKIQKWREKTEQETPRSSKVSLT